MRCATHRETEAIAVCRACFKGVCPACAVPTGRSVTCSSECAADAAKVLRVIAVSGRNTRAVQRMQGALFLVLALGTAFGAIIAKDVGRWVLATAAALLFLVAYRFFRLAADWRDVEGGVAGSKPSSSGP